MNKDCLACGSTESVVTMVMDENYEECVVCGEVNSIKIEGEKCL